jgi:hypothetical protein
LIVSLDVATAARGPSEKLVAALKRHRQLFG